jgi:hypothetical protein
MSFDPKKRRMHTHQLTRQKEEEEHKSWRFFTAKTLTERRVARARTYTKTLASAAAAGESETFSAYFGRSGAGDADMEPQHFKRHVESHGQLH